MNKIYILNKLDIKGNLALEGFSEKFIEKHWLKFHYVLTRVLFQYIRKGKRSDGFVKLHIESIKKVTKSIRSSTIPSHFRTNPNSIHLHLLIVKLLKKWGVIIPFTEQKVDKRIFKCKIKDEWYLDGYSLYRGSVPDKIQKSIDEVKDINENKLEGVYCHVFDSFNRVRLDESKSLEWLEKAYSNGLRLRDKQDKYGNWNVNFMDIISYSYYKMVIETFNDAKYFYKAKSGRVYSSVTNMPSALRQYLHIDGDYLKEYDVSCAQPLILNHIVDTDYLYEKHTREATFYSSLKDELESRNIKVSNNFKVTLFSKIFFGTHKRKSKEEKVFEELYPTTHFSIRYLKHVKGYKSLSEILQKREAYIIFQEVIKKLLSLNITDFVTVHDAILVKESDYKTTIKVMEECFYL